MAHRCVPVHMGSPHYDVLDVGTFRLTHAWFPPNLVLPPHVHERSIFAVMLEGSFRDRFTRREYECDPSTVFTEPAGERHANHIENAGARVLVIQPDPDDEELLRPCRDVFSRVNHFRHGRIAGLGHRLARECASPDAVSPLAAEGLVLEMLAEAARLESRRRRDRDPPRWLEDARELIHERFTEGLRIAEIAAAVDVHPSHLARVFRAHYHTAIGSYIRNLRIEWATTRLREGEETLSTIAVRAGFADQSHFTRAFKRHMGTTPGRYRATRG